MEPAGQLPTQQRTPAFWGPRPGPEMVTVPGATEEMPCLSQTGTKLGPHSPWGASHGLVRTLFYQPAVCFYLAVIKEHLAPSGRLLCVSGLLCTALRRPSCLQHGLRTAGLPGRKLLGEVTLGRPGCLAFLATTYISFCGTPEAWNLPSGLSSQHIGPCPPSSFPLREVGNP